MVLMQEKALCNLGPKIGHYQESSKCWLIVKPQLVKEAEKLFKNTKISITINGQRHLVQLMVVKNIETNI